MYKKWLCPIVIALICFTASRGLANIYRWTDEKGITHFTDDRQKIPPAYREKVVVNKTYIDPSPVSVARINTTVAGKPVGSNDAEAGKEPENPETVPPKKPTVEDYQVKTDKDKTIMEKMQKNIQTLERKIFDLERQEDEHKEKLAAVTDAPTAVRVKNDLKQVQLAIDACRIQIETYKKDLSTLDDNIRSYQDEINRLK